MADDLTGEAVVFVTCGISGWRHVGCLSSGWLGPRGGIAARVLCHGLGRMVNNLTMPFPMLCTYQQLHAGLSSNEELIELAIS
jgi:hypothetical protein